MSKPWSQSRETFLRIVRDTCAYAALGAFAGVIGAVIRHNHRLAIDFLVIIGVLLVGVGWAVNALADILPNKVAGDIRRLTPWSFWPHTADAVTCMCQRVLSFREDATWHPNEGRHVVDPGGGRWAMVCPCGRGHYKFNVDPRTDPSRDAA